MARKLKFDEKTVVVHSKIRELEILYKRYGLFEAAIPAMALRQSLTFKESAALEPVMDFYLIIDCTLPSRHASSLGWSKNEKAIQAM